MPSPQMTAIIADLRRHMTCFEMNRGTYGRDMTEIVAQGTYRQLDTKRTPDGYGWAPLSGSYRAWKEKHYPGMPMAVLHGILKTMSNCRGSREFTDDNARVTFGDSPEAREEASWFEEGDPEQHRPARRFNGLSAETRRNLDARSDKEFQDKV